MIIHRTAPCFLCKGGELQLPDCGHCGGTGSVPLEQGSQEWLNIRTGIPTTSQFHRIVTPAKWSYSKQATDYRNQLLAERATGGPVDNETWTRYMERGNALEMEAVRYYELQKDVDVDRVAFVTDDDLTVGCSPDGLVGDDGGAEIKCFAPKHHYACLLGDDPAKATQIMGSILVCEREWWDQLAFLPKRPPVLIRTYRDEKKCKALADALARFREEMEWGQKVLDALGPRGRTESLETLLVTA